MEALRNNLKYSFEFAELIDLNVMTAASAEAKIFFEKTESEKLFFVKKDYYDAGYRSIKNKELYMLRHKNEFSACSILAESLHELCKKILCNVACELKLAPSLFLDLIDETAIPKTGYGNSLMRLNHYKAQPGNREDILSEAHQDLGVLTLICPVETPALEIYDYLKYDWVDVETHQEKNKIIIMVGESLSTITNHYYLPATHRVLCPTQNRTSLVYHLRFRNDAILDSKLFESEVTGKFHKPFRMTGEAYLKSETSVRKSVNGSY
ncbi:MAG: hypothetical protein COY58_01310 [Gammaproteobacteria bacterium CG_4_10_14_0_8_um_filter_38_16]|nr:MAG: hypothetical protein COY58_01310 [Gammaproteobacteria bacterium CG_4_10_14_0_8_um_filter_38_16]PJA03278.1 MAG: hypothetical protein COX72_06310 [Gammaproteobacteria bacterium CG_4_10_14_0_2_um_filter_38_22]PJB09820.1 MAG: hypothetical protein CO120_07895 [Gammaproteobacteria bacterium CG_4_9_14_3_um_filter_38_9]